VTPLVVVAAVIEDADRFLVTRRQAGVHLEGLWEFPGGKIDGEETHADALRREIREELDADVEVGDLVLATTHVYPLVGTPRPLLGQDMQWVTRAGLSTLGFPAADEALINLLSQTAAR
jgi:mutator protein MutT